MSPARSGARTPGPLATLMIVLLAFMLLPLPLAPAQDDGGETEEPEESSGETVAEPPEDWVAWYDESLRMRVPIHLSLTGSYPSDWAGDRVVAHALDVTAALERGGWPTDPVTGLPFGFSLDLDSLRVVPATADGQPVPHRAWRGAPFEAQGSFPVGHEVVTVAFTAPEGVSDFFVYFDRVEDNDENDHDPLPRDPIADHRILQALAGPGAAHKSLGLVQGSAKVQIGSAYGTSFQLERLTAEGWASVPCTSPFVGPSTWATCSIGGATTAEPIRVVSQRPVAAYAYPTVAYEGNKQFDKQKVMPLAGAHGGLEDTVLLAPSPSTDTRLYLMSARPCQGGCTASLSAGGPGTVPVGVGIPTQVRISQPTLITSEQPIMGWVHGKGCGPAMLPLAINETATTSAVVVPDEICDAKWDVVATGDFGARVVLFDQDGTSTLRQGLEDGETLNPAHEVGAATWQEPSTTSGEGWVMQGQGALFWTQMLETDKGNALNGIVQLPPTPVGAAGWISRTTDSKAPVRVLTMPFAGEFEMRLAMQGTEVTSGDASFEDPLRSGSLAYGEGTTSEQIDEDGAMAEAWGVGNVGPVAAWAAYGEASQHATSGLFAGQLTGVPAEEGAPDILGPLFQLVLDPQDVFARPGETINLRLLGTGFIQEVDGSRSALTISLTSEAEHPDTVPRPDLLLGRTGATLDPESLTEITTVQVRLPAQYPPDVLPATYAIDLVGEPAGGGDVVTASSAITVRVKRDISLTFEDGTHTNTVETEDGGVTTSLVLRNLGTGPQGVGLTVNLPPIQGWSARLLDRGEPISALTLPPGGQRTLELDIDAPEGTSLILDVVVAAQGVEDASVSDSVVAQVVHGVDLDVDARIRPDLISLPRGAQAQVNLVLENHGSPVNVKVEPIETEGLVLEPTRRSINLGEPGTGVENETVPMNVTVAPDAPLGAVLVGTLRTELGRGDLEPTVQLLSLRARVVATHGLQVDRGLDLLPGLRQPVRVDVLNQGDADEDLALSLLTSPRGWDVELPARLQIPQNTTTPLRFNVTVPPGEEPSTDTLRLLAEPAGSDTSIPVTIPVTVQESPAFAFDVPASLQMGLGETRTLAVELENRGNAPGDARLTVEGSGIEAQVNPEQLTLAPGEGAEFALSLTATEPGAHAITVAAENGDSHEIDLETGRVAFEVELVSMNPSPPRTGEPFKALVSVTNTGDAAARDISLVLSTAEGTLVTETIGMLDPGRSATINLATNSLPTLDGLSVAVDPEGRYEHDGATTSGFGAQGNDAPSHWVSGILAIACAAAIAHRRRREV